MTPKIFLIQIAVLMLACSGSSTDSKSVENTSPPEIIYPKLLINKMTGYDSSGTIARRDSIYAMKDDYFEISLDLLAKSDKYMANKKIGEFNVKGPIHLVQLYVVDSTGQNIHFSGTTEFLNFMSERDYELVSQMNKEYGTDYTFKHPHSP